MKVTADTGWSVLACARRPFAAQAWASIVLNIHIMADSPLPLERMQAYNQNGAILLKRSAGQQCRFHYAGQQEHFARSSERQDLPEISLAKRSIL